MFYNSSRGKEWHGKNLPKKLEYNSRWNKTNPEKRILYRSRTSAKKRGHIHTLTEKDIVIPKYCTVLGIKLVQGGKTSFDSPSIDRIDNDKGYVPGNVMIISQRANTIKNNATIEELEKIIEYMKRYKKG